MHESFCIKDDCLNVASTSQLAKRIRTVDASRPSDQEADEGPDARARIVTQTIIDATERMQAAEQEAVRLAGLLTDSMEVTSLAVYLAGFSRDFAAQASQLRQTGPVAAKTPPAEACMNCCCLSSATNPCLRRIDALHATNLRPLHAQAGQALQDELDAAYADGAAQVARLAAQLQTAVDASDCGAEAQAAEAAHLAAELQAATGRQADLEQELAVMREEAELLQVHFIFACSSCMPARVAARSSEENLRSSLLPRV